MGRPRLAPARRSPPRSRLAPRPSIPLLASLLALASCSSSSEPPPSGSAGQTQASGAAGTTTTGGSGGAAGASGTGASAGASAGGQAGQAGAPAAPWTFETVETRSRKVLDQPRSVELIRGTRPDGKHTYLVYVPGLAKLSPVMVLEQPYDGLDWTGEEVDAKWAARGPGIHPDDDAPGYNGKDLTSYQPMTPEQAAEASTVHLINGNAALFDYGRFYAGGSLEDDIVDATAAYHFTLTRPDELDAQRVGVFGGSWGGMMALFGASRVPAGITLQVAVALAPPSDFVALWDWTTVSGPEVYPDEATFRAFYSPYQRRIVAATGGPPAGSLDAWAPYRPQAICQTLTAPTLVLHDTWDVLVPCDQTRALVPACPDRIRPLYWPRTLPIDYAKVGMDHGLIGQEPGFPTVFTFAYLHAHRVLAGDSKATIYAVVHGEALRELATLLHDAQARGEDTSYAPPLLRELCDARVTAFDPTDGSMIKGATLLTAEVNAVWKTTHTETSLCAALASGLPAL